MVLLVLRRSHLEEFYQQMHQIWNRKNQYRSRIKGHRNSSSDRWMMRHNLVSSATIEWDLVRHQDKSNLKSLSHRTPRVCVKVTIKASQPKKEGDMKRQHWATARPEKTLLAQVLHLTGYLCMIPSKRGWMNSRENNWTKKSLAIYQEHCMMKIKEISTYKTDLKIIHGTSKAENRWTRCLSNPRCIRSSTSRSKMTSQREIRTVR
mgnify:CR=1 FL=1